VLEQQRHALLTVLELRHTTNGLLTVRHNGRPLCQASQCFEGNRAMLPPSFMNQLCISISGEAKNDNNAKSPSAEM
jgi:hypothetical protein